MKYFSNTNDSCHGVYNIISRNTIYVICTCNSAAAITIIVIKVLNFWNDRPILRGLLEELSQNNHGAVQFVCKIITITDIS